MIHLIYKSYLLLILFPIMSYAGLPTGEDGDFSKNYHKEYDVPKDATVEIINKYGYVKVHAWDKRICSMDVNILANTTSKEKADDIFARISINFTNTANYIKAETVIDDSKSKNWFDWKSIFNWGNNNSSYKINYDVYIPTDLYLKLSNKYGDSFVDRMDRDVTLTIKYGNIRLDDVNGNADLDLAYGDGTFSSIRDGKLKLRYSKLKMNNMNNGNLDFKYSDIKMKSGGNIRSESAYGELNAENINSLDLNSKYDDIILRNVGELYANSGYTDYDINRLGKKSSFTVTYGDIIIRDIDPEFKSADIKSSYTDVRISVHGAPFRLDASGSYSDIKYPSDFNSTYQVEKSSSKSVKGYSKGENEGGMIRASMSYGGLRID